MSKTGNALSVLFAICIGVAQAGCPTEADPLYCDEAMPCEAGLRCVHHGCVSLDDMGARDAAADLTQRAGAPCADSADCPAAEPVCRDSHCGSCSGGIDECARFHAKRPYCTLQGACGECVTSNDCPDARPVCQRGACVTCDGDEDCAFDATRPHCDEDGRCVRCRDMRDCGARDPMCDPSTRACAACVDDGDCARFADSAHCDPSSGGCVGCVSDEQCAASLPSCERRQCGACVSDAQCAHFMTERRCAAASGECVECTDSSQCPSERPVCEGRRCVGCKQPGSSTECLRFHAATPFCGPSGACAECADGGACPEDRPVCEGGRCASCDTPGPLVECQRFHAAKPYCGLAGGCAECFDGSTCPRDLPVCGAHGCARCDAAGPSMECERFHGDTPRCGAEGYCVECLSAADCASQQLACIGEACAPCMRGVDCASGVCTDDHRCALPSEIAYIDNHNGACTGTHAGTASDPYCDGLDALAAGPRKPFFYFAGSDAPYSSLRLTGGKPSLLAGPGKDASPTASLLGRGTPALDVDVASSLSLSIDGLALRAQDAAPAGLRCHAAAGVLAKLLVNDTALDGSSGSGALLDGCDLQLTDCRVNGNGGDGLEGTSAPQNQLRVDRSLIADNTRGGLSISGALVTLTYSTLRDNGGPPLQINASSQINLLSNTIKGNAGALMLAGAAALAMDANTVIKNQGGLGVATAKYDITNNLFAQSGDSVTLGAVRLASSSQGRFAFNTVAENHAPSDYPGGVLCDGGQTIEHAIVWGNDRRDGTQLKSCVLLDIVADLDESNGAARRATPTFVNRAAADYHLVRSDTSNRACCVDQVSSGSALPTTDLDGESRPLGGGWDVGADEVE